MRTLQHQLQDLADWCAGLALPPMSAEERFPNPVLRSGWHAVSYLTEVEGSPTSFRERCLAEARPAMVGFIDGLQLYNRLCRVIPSNERPFRSLAEIAGELPPIEWLWKPWIAQATLSLLVAEPGVGKSLIALDLAGRIMTAAPWPDGTPADRPPSNIIYVDGESIPQVHNARAEAWGLPREQLYMLLPAEEDLLVDLSEFRYQELLVQMVFRLKPALVIIDSLGAVMGKGENAVEDVRGMLGFLATLAQHYEVAVLAIHHLRKAPPGVAAAGALDQSQVRGSSHITAMARVVCGVRTVQTGPKPRPEDPRVLQVIKSNLARAPEPLGVRFAPVAGTEHIRVTYDPHAPVPYGEAAARTPAQEWLLDFLAAAEGPIPTGDVVEAGGRAGISRRSLYRARAVLEGTVVTRGHRGAVGACWQLADQETDSATVPLCQAPSPGPDLP